MYHPDYVFKGRTLSRLPEQIEVKDRGLNSFFLRLPEVRASLSAMLDEPSLSPEGKVTLKAMLEYRWDSYVQIIQRLGKPTTDSERREKYEALLEYCRDGGRKSARVLKLAEKLKTWLEHSDTVLSTAIDEEESEFLLLDLEDEIRAGLYTDPTSRDEFTALLNDVHKGDVQSLMASMKSKLNAWSFIQLMNVLAGPFVAAAKAIERESSKDGVCCDAVFKKLDKEAQDLFDKAANMILKSTNDQVVGREGFFMKMVSTHYSLMDATHAKHIKTIEQMIMDGRISKDEDDEYVPIIDQESKEMKALHKYLWEIRHLEEGDTHYWKKQMFLDRGINISKMEDAYKAKAKIDAAKKMSGKRAAREANTKDRKKKRRPR